MTEDTKEIIDLAGKIDWRTRNNKFDGAIQAVRLMRIRLDRTEKYIKSQLQDSVK